MDDKERYKQLVKENNDRMKTFGQEYASVAQTYLKRARGYAAKTIDNENKIKKTLESLALNELHQVNLHVLIPNLTNYIELEVAKLSKKVVNRKEQIQSIVAITILMLVFLSWIIVDIAFRKTTPLQTPQNLAITELENNQVRVQWDAVPNASNGYCIYYEKEGIAYTKQEIVATSAILTFPTDKGTYTIYLYAKKVTYSTFERTLFDESSKASITYEVK